MQREEMLKFAVKKLTLLSERIIAMTVNLFCNFRMYG